MSYGLLTLLLVLIFCGYGLTRINKIEDSLNPYKFFKKK